MESSIGEFGVSIIANLLSSFIYDKLKKKKQLELTDLQELMKEALDSVMVQIDERLGERLLSSQEIMVQRFKQEVIPEIIMQIPKSEVNMESVINQAVEEVAKNFYYEIHKEKLRLEKLNEQLESLVKSLSKVIEQYPLALFEEKEVKQVPKIKTPVKLYSNLEIGKSTLTTHDILEPRFVGHYKLASGKHSDRYIHVRLALSSEEYATKFAQEIIELFNDEKIDAVAGFTVGGILLAKAIHESLGAKLIIGKKKPEGVVFVNLDELRIGDNILLVDDVLTTGEYIKKAIDAIKGSGKGVIKGCAVVVDRSKESVHLGVKTIRLISI